MDDAAAVNQKRWDVLAGRHGTAAAAAGLRVESLTEWFD
jgi:hypothetical protein